MSKKEHEYGLPTKETKPPFPAKLVAPFIVIVLVMASFATTQYIAHQFDYHSALGGFNGLYWPWAWIGWLIDYGEQYRQEFTQGLAAGVLVAGFILALFTIVRTVSLKKSKKYADLHGSARWAKKDEIKKMSLLENEGVYIGAYKDKKTKKIKYLQHNGPEHILTFAPTRSGKGIGLVLPTLLSWLESVFVLDIKGENWALTSGWRSKYANNRCIRFDPSNPDPTQCDGFNPLEEIRVGTQNEVGDSQNLALMLVDPLGKGLNDHWTKTAFALLTGVILYEALLAAETGEHTNLTKLAYRLSDPDKPSDELWEEMCAYKNPVVAASGRDMIDRPEEERGSVLSTAKSFLSLYVDPVVSQNTAKSSFKIRDLMNGEQPVSLYLVINPADKGRLMPLIRIILAQTIRTLVEKMEFKDGRSVRHYKYRLLLLLDEFASLGKIEILEEALHYMAGYGLKGYLIAQDIEQIRNRERGYGTEENVSSGCHIKNAFAPNKLETAKYLSQMCGETTVLKEAITTSGKRTGVMMSNMSKTIQETKRPLLTPDECTRLPAAEKNAKGEVTEAGDMLIFSAGQSPIYGKQILYFKDPIFLERAKVEPPIKAEVYEYGDINDVSGVEEVITDKDVDLFGSNEAVEPDVVEENTDIEDSNDSEEQPSEPDETEKKEDEVDF